MEKQGVVILDADRKIRVLTPIAEELLGWGNQEVAGRPCAAVLQCQDERGQSLCEQCGFVAALARHELLPPTVMWIADPEGSRRPMSTAFWYLPPAGRFWEARVMAVVRPGDVNAGALEQRLTD
jgi:PAS domain-containing protein